MEGATGRRARAATSAGVYDGWERESQHTCLPAALPSGKRRNSRENRHQTAVHLFDRFSGTRTDTTLQRDAAVEHDCRRGLLPQVRRQSRRESLTGRSRLALLPRMRAYLAPRAAASGGNDRAVAPIKTGAEANRLGMRACQMRNPHSPRYPSVASPKSCQHRGRRFARPARREEDGDRESSTEEQRSAPGCSAGRT